MVNQYHIHIYWPVTASNCPSWISSRCRMTTEIVSFCTKIYGQAGVRVWHTWSAWKAFRVKHAAQWRLSEACTSTQSLLSVRRNWSFIQLVWWEWYRAALLVPIVPPYTTGEISAILLHQYCSMVWTVTPNNLKEIKCYATFKPWF